MTGPLSVDVIYAANMKPGDLYAGDVDTNSSGRPVHPSAAALRLTEVIKHKGGDGEIWMHLKAEGLEAYPLTPVLAHTQVLIIRGA